MNDRMVDKLIDKLDEIQKELVEIKLDLAEHIHRTDLNEENIKMLRSDFAPVKKQAELINLLYKIGLGMGGLALFGAQMFKYLS